MGYRLSLLGKAPTFHQPLLPPLPPHLLRHIPYSIYHARIPLHTLLSPLKKKKEKKRKKKKKKRQGKKRKRIKGKGKGKGKEREKGKGKEDKRSTMSAHEAETKKFAPAHAVALDKPKDDPITLEELSKADGKYLLPSPLPSLLPSQRCVSL